MHGLLHGGLHNPRPCSVMPLVSGEAKEALKHQWLCNCKVYSCKRIWFRKLMNGKYDFLILQDWYFCNLFYLYDSIILLPDKTGPGLAIARYKRTSVAAGQ